MYNDYKTCKNNAVCFLDCNHDPALTMTDTTRATPSDTSRTDYELLNAAENIERLEQNLTYDNNGQSQHTIRNIDQQRHQEIIKELNSRGIYHKSQQIDTSLYGEQNRDDRYQQSN